MLTKLQSIARKTLIALVILGPAVLGLNGSDLTPGRLAANDQYLAARKEARLRIGAYVAFKNPHKSKAERMQLVEVILDQSERLRIPEHFYIDGLSVHPAYFLTALIGVESTFYRDAVSHADARGYMQLMPATVAWMDVNLLSEGNVTELDRLFEARTNVARGVSYLNFLIKEMDDIRLVCLAYNAGPGNVRRGYWVEEYWTRVHANYREIRRGEFLFREVRGTVTL